MKVNLKKKRYDGLVQCAREVPAQSRNAGRCFELPDFLSVIFVKQNVKIVFGFVFNDRTRSKDTTLAFLSRFKLFCQTKNI